MTIAGSRNRRHFLRFLAGSPLLAGAFAQQGPGSEQALTDPKEALDVMEFEAAARKALPPIRQRPGW